MEEIKTQFVLTESEKYHINETLTLLEKIRYYCSKNKCNIETSFDTISIMQLTQMISFFNRLCHGQYCIEKEKD